MNDVHAPEEIAAEFSPEQDVTRGRWFGKPCLKVGGKVFAIIHGSEMAFKLTGQAHAQALQVPGAHLFDPRGQGHPLKQWIQIPQEQSSSWSHFAQLACQFVASAAQAKKDEIIGDLESARSKVLAAVHLLPPEALDEVFLGEWSVKDMLAHLAGWDDTNMRAVKEILAGQEPRFWEHYDRDWRSYNARLVSEYKRDSFSELLAVVRASHKRLIDYLETLPADYYARYGKIGSLLRAEARDEEEHYEQVEAFKRRLAALT